MSSVTEILDRLVGFPSVVGKPNAPIVSYVKEYFIRHGATVVELPGPEGDRSNLFASFGPLDRPGLILSGHMDVVPAGGSGWTSDPFVLRRDGQRLYGRGTTDMKGFLAAAMAIVPEVAGERLERPLHFAFSYDEEVGCKGVPHMIEKIPSLCALPFGCIVGEPSGMTPILAHKGKAAARVSVEGTAGHSSRPDLSLNAIHALSDLLAKAVAQSESLQTADRNALFTPPYSTLQVGIVNGGQALNISPQHAAFEMEVRAIPGVPPAGLFAPVLEMTADLEAKGFKVTAEQIAEYPGMALPADSELAALMTAATGREAVKAVSYGTEAGLFEKLGIPSIICGPGDIDRAHKVDEYVLLSELEDCCRVIRNVIARLKH